MRRLALERTQDGTLRTLVSQLSQQLVAGHDDLTAGDVAGPRGAHNVLCPKRDRVRNNWIQCRIESWSSAALLKRSSCRAHSAATSCSV